jgi:hypothetical protein
MENLLALGENERKFQLTLPPSFIQLELESGR